jgi:hypothetical protein
MPVLIYNMAIDTRKPHLMAASHFVIPDLEKIANAKVINSCCAPQCIPYCLSDSCFSDAPIM